MGPDHPDLSNTLGNYALLLMDQGRHAEAEPLLQRALSIRERALGLKHPAVANTLSSLGGLYRDTGRLDEAAIWC